MRRNRDDNGSHLRIEPLCLTALPCYNWVGMLPLEAARDSASVLLKAVLNVALESSTCDYYDIIDLDPRFIPSEWQALVGDRGPDEPRVFNRRHLEVVTILELAEAIKAGGINVIGSLSYDDF